MQKTHNEISVIWGERHYVHHCTVVTGMGFPPLRAPAELEKQASRVRRWLVMRRAGEGEGTIEVYSI